MKKNFLKELLEWAIAIAAVCVVFLIIQAYIFKLAIVDGPSMEPTLKNKDRILVTKFIYKFKQPKRGDIIIFPYKEDKKQFYVKRIIGVEDDIIDIKNSAFILNGQPLDDEFSQLPLTTLGDVTFPITVPKDCFFVLGDNRNLSKDSRHNSVGFIPKEEIVGKVDVKLLPISEAEFLK